MKKLAPLYVQRKVAALHAKVEAIATEIVAIKARCSHEWKYERDPSGNNDSGYYCRACGSWRRNLP